MNSMKGKHKDFYTKEYHCQIAENKWQREKKFQSRKN